MEPQPQVSPAPAPTHKGSGGVGWIIGLLAGVGCLALLGLVVVGLGAGAYFVMQRQQDKAELARWDAERAAREREARDLLAGGNRYDDPLAGRNPNLRGNPADPSAPRFPSAPRPQAVADDAVARVPVGDSPQRGPDDALVTIVEFADFECPFSARVTDTLDQIARQYGDDVRIVFKHNPLPFHPRAAPAAHAAIEVHERRGDEAFWKMHGLLFDDIRALGDTDLARYARQAGARPAQVRRAIRSRGHHEVIERDQELARRVGATGTPTFFINGRKLSGAQPLAAFRAAIDRELENARGLVQQGTPRDELYDTILERSAL